MIQIKNVSFSYSTNEVDVLKNINLNVQKGEFVLLTGISGSDKTTVTKLINGIIPEFENSEFTGDEFRNLSNDTLNSLGLRSANLSNVKISRDVKRTKIDEFLNIENVNFSYDNGQKVLKDMSISLNKGDIVAILGENGAGKTTLMELICGLRKEKSGSFYINHELKSLKDRQKDTYLVMQNQSISFSQKVLKLS